MQTRYMLAIGLVALAICNNLALALYWPNDEPDDGRFYAQIAKNVLLHKSYSGETVEPFAPTYVRMPGYPLFLAAVYGVFGVDNNQAVRIFQALVNVLSGLLVGWLAFLWSPQRWTDDERFRSFLVALGLASIFPFTSIYAATILTESWAIFWSLLCIIFATVGAKAADQKRYFTWLGSGLAGGIATLFRPECALFSGAAGCIMLVSAFPSKWSSQASRLSFPTLRPILNTLFFHGIALVLGFSLALAPWIVRNARVFCILQPISPMNGTMPGEFAPDGYYKWLLTWMVEMKYMDPLNWSLDDKPIQIEQFPAEAFASNAERETVKALLVQYNMDKDKDKDDPDPDPDPNDPPDASTIEPKKPDAPPKFAGGMNAEIDAAFMRLANDRCSKHPVDCYLFVPFKRAASIWFSTHSDYFPFSGDLFPWDDLDKSTGQHIWLPLCAVVVVMLTVLMVAGLGVLAIHGETHVLLFTLFIFIPRMLLLGELAFPEPRYVVLLFPFALVCSALACNCIPQALFGIRRVKSV